MLSSASVLCVCNCFLFYVILKDVLNLSLFFFLSYSRKKLCKVKGIKKFINAYSHFRIADIRLTLCGRLGQRKAFHEYYLLLLLI